MKHIISILILLLTCTVIYAGSTRYIDADIVRSSDHTKTWTMPAASGTLSTSGSSSGYIYVGKVVASGCSAAWARSTASMGNFSTVSSCSYTVTGGGDAATTLYAPATNIPGFKIDGPAGSYFVEYAGGIGVQSGSSTFCQFRVSDGTNVSANLVPIYYGGSSGQLVVGTAKFNITEGSTMTGVTIQVQGYPDAGTCQIQANSGATDSTFYVYRQ